MGWSFLLWGWLWCFGPEVLTLGDLLSELEEGRVLLRGLLGLLDHGRDRQGPGDQSPVRCSAGGTTGRSGRDRLPPLRNAAIAAQPSGVPTLAASAAVKAARRFSSFGSITQALAAFSAASRGRRRLGTHNPLGTETCPPHGFALGQGMGQELGRVAVKLLVDQHGQKLPRDHAVLKQRLGFIAQGESLSDLRGGLGCDLRRLALTHNLTTDPLRTQKLRRSPSPEWIVNALGDLDYRHGLADHRDPALGLQHHIRFDGLISPLTSVWTWPSTLIIIPLIVTPILSIVMLL